jgi:hypothetical protein
VRDQKKSASSRKQITQAAPVASKLLHKRRKGELQNLCVNVSTSFEQQSCQGDRALFVLKPVQHVQQVSPVAKLAVNGESIIEQVHK